MNQTIKLSDQIIAAHDALRERVLLAGSISYLQRKLGYSYNRAALILAFMEDAKVIGVPNNLGDRRWLIGDRARAVETLRGMM
jgi:DNA segregation ATPase FtsK/SpoIIIE-like protein